MRMLFNLYNYAKASYSIAVAFWLSFKRDRVKLSSTGLMGCLPPGKARQRNIGISLRVRRITILGLDAILSITIVS